MPMDRRLYPNDWEAIASGIKQEVNWCCEQCGRPCLHPGESWTDLLKRLNHTVEQAIAARERQFVLTVAHLDHIPQNTDRSNLKALCAPCHCRYDLAQMALKVRLKRERQGQLRLFSLEQVGELK